MLVSVREGGRCVLAVFFFQAEDGIRDLVRSRGLGDAYKRQVHQQPNHNLWVDPPLLAEANFAEVVLVLGLEIQRLSLIHI